ncbi:MAG: hypothetical protein H6780_02350 [Candidatus Nomurabacteria bacterium]|nr:MAG: hypothetical protein H6780_02350 [Candidatus Nomurabacteria bacterium]
MPTYPESVPQSSQGDEVVLEEVSNQAIIELQGPVLAALFDGNEESVMKWIQTPGNGDVLRTVVTEYLEEGGDPAQVEVVVEQLRERLRSVGGVH